MYIEYNSNPDQKLVGDCVIRALSKILNLDWERIYMEVCIQGFMMHDMPSSNNVWGGYLFTKGYRRFSRHTATEKMINELEMMMKDAETSKKKNTIQRCIDELKNK